MNLQDPSLFKNQNYINGQWVDAASGQVFDVVNPANGEVVGQVADGSAADTKVAIEAAEKALPAWRNKTAKERANILRRWYDLMMENQEDLATIMTIEQGKPLFETRGEVGYGASFVEWFAEEGKRTYGEVIPHVFNDRRQVVIKQPIGVVGAITPWNFPNAMITRKAAPALAAGCTFVVKPDAGTPYSALALAELATRAGIPEGVFNIVCGSDSAAIGEELTSNRTVRKITFTGSTRVGKILLRQSAETVKRVSMELGGNAPVLVFDDADLDKAVAGALGSRYRNAGQTCVCANRIYVQESIHDAFVEKFTAAVAAMKLGNGMEKGVTMGPLIHEQAVERVDGMVQDALQKGATATTGGKRSDLGSCFYEPTVLTNVDKSMRVFQEEIFGPVAPIFTFKTEEEAIELANDTEYGLAAYFYSRDIGRCWRVAEGVDFGMVGVNEVAITSEMMPFGGVKDSGMGREGSHMGIDEYLEVKYICMGGL